ncbi:class I SAM-dependent methyltransferase [Bacillus infantis]|uniref:class I SAM-dependent methyltransferase n=1 Tax=Bacillus infantis TaxID=324767 RepID=UPI00101DCB30|nr:methyltransferase domain-containing protein [Bacillus infantis]MCA1037391.1 class I SAM-dependent methyltransferase [Bacillus infantis]MCK6208240.1 class I SAM-dependent methyltransferase [Bacillus infantis]RYI25659.1 class I SAM-dependent methyltransferase [Bacillus infantis]
MYRAYFDFLVKQAEKEFTGWDFSYLTETGRMASEPLAWNYTNWVLPEMLNAASMLDMGTGGGEFLSLLSPLPSYTAATEGYGPNIEIAAERLRPLGIEVYEVKDDSGLPFGDRLFDLVINRHESYDTQEVNRILKPGGVFITQQVGGTDNLGLNRMLGAKEDFGHEGWHLEKAVRQLEDAGFHIVDSYEAYPYTRFYDVGAILYYLKAIPWQIEGFTAARYEKKLRELHGEIQRTGYTEVRSHRFIIKAQKPAGSAGLLKGAE